VSSPGVLHADEKEAAREGAGAGFAGGGRVEQLAHSGFVEIALSRFEERPNNVADHVLQKTGTADPVN
jgi:hypothetical protein